MTIITNGMPVWRKLSRTFIAILSRLLNVRTSIANLKRSMKNG